MEKKQEAAIAAQEAEIAGLIGTEDGTSTQADGDNLWVVKYKPSGYAELLSEEVDIFCFMSQNG